ncbi:hypothetical protein DFJ58DRAFT_749681 [Suillus subalutaceus]|uniref:uncharacterized protein n=1 Tax=Suillus subalutaceus TaxID=48586 RepID=UPI001B883988|nr:uncharacterized protein DFJ58DRAFT_749681 [Suillus subalutaceus]KAG1836836.1 hypothetical protein DFJ58DRAFT_749681 [Suillus subalutaceus]
MPPRAVASPKKKRSKRKASDASKASLPKKPRAANPVEIPSMPLVSLGLTKVDAADAAPRLLLEAKSGIGNQGHHISWYGQSREPSGSRTHRKGERIIRRYNTQSLLSVVLITSVPAPVPHFLLQQNGGRFGFAASTTNRVVPPGAEPNPQVLNNPYLEQRNQNTFADHSRSSQPQTNCYLDPMEDSDSSGSGTDTDIDKDDNEEGEDEARARTRMRTKETKEENNESQFGWGEAHQRQKGHPGFSAEGLPTQARVARPLTPDFEFQYSRDEDEDSARMRLNNSNQPLGTLPGVQQERSDPQTNTSKAEDVLKRHHKKNGQPRLPDPETLQLLNQVAESVDQSRRCQETISEVLLSVLVAWDKNGRQFEAGVWPEQQYNMTRLLYDDLSTWRSDLKKIAISIAPLSYSLLPPPSVPPQQRATWVENAAKIYSRVVCIYGLE